MCSSPVEFSALCQGITLIVSISRLSYEIPQLEKEKESSLSIYLCATMQILSPVLTA